MENQMFIPLKIEESTLKGFEDIFKAIALKTIEEMKVSNHIQPYLNKKQASQYIGISFNTLKKFIDEGLPVIDVSGVQMIRKVDIDQFLEERRK